MLTTQPQPHQPEHPGLATREAWQVEIASRRNVGGTALSNIQEPQGINDLDDKTRAYDALTQLLSASDEADEEYRSALQHIRTIERAARGQAPPITGDPRLVVQPVRLIDPRPIVMDDPKIKQLVSDRDIDELHHQLLEDWPSFIREYTSGIRRGVELGYIPAAVMDHLPIALATTSVRVVDAAIDTYDPAFAYYNSYHDEVGLRHNLEDFGQHLHDSLVHEFTHKLSGGTFTLPGPGSTEYYRPRVGFSTEMEPDDMNRIGLNEAVTHHLMQAILTGDFETLDPQIRQDDEGYYNYRKLLATFVGRSVGVVKVKTVTNAYFEDSGPDGIAADRRKLVQATVQAYGAGALTRLDRLMSLTERVDPNRLDEVVLSRIHPPTLDKDGNVVATGVIDTENLPGTWSLPLSERSKKLSNVALNF